jgi:nucleotide-binding universal stress UspA family protein
VDAWSPPLQRSFAGEALLGTPVDDVQEMAEGLARMFAAHALETADEGVARAREHGLDARAMPVECRGGAWRAVSDAADAHGAAAIVAGSRGRGAVTSAVLGSVSTGLAHNAARPVLIARPPGGGQG